MATRQILTILAVSDIERSVRFYDEAFGWPKRVQVEVYVEYELEDQNGVGLYKREGFERITGRYPDPVPTGALTGAELYFRCDDLDDAVRRLEAAGAHLLSKRQARDWGDEAAYYADPDGNVLVVAVPLAG